MRVRTLAFNAFQQVFPFGQPGVIKGFTTAADNEVVLGLLVAAKPDRLLEIGTGLGAMTACLSRWSPDGSLTFSLGLSPSMESSHPVRQQDGERDGWASRVAHYGTTDKIVLLLGDSLTYNFARWAPYDFVFIDGAHDERHVKSDSERLYPLTRSGGFIVWHDYGSRAEWVKVSEVLGALPWRETVTHVLGTEVAFAQKL